MTAVFADTSYWVAIIDARDQWHSKASSVGRSLDNVLLLTTDEVLIELLAFFSAFDPRMRQYVAEFVRALLASESHVQVVAQSRESFWLASIFMRRGRTRTTVSSIVYRCNS